MLEPTNYITMINCKFCNQEMISHELKFFDRRKLLIKCDNHLPVKVTFSPIENSKQFGDRWIISLNDYRLVYYTMFDRTIFQLRHPDESAAKYYENIKRFDGELNITPEQFPDKIKTLLVWS